MAEASLKAKETYDFVVAHMITGGENAGGIEILTHKEAAGLRVKVSSLSLISIAYKETVKTGDTFMTPFYCSLYDGKYFSSDVCTQKK